jgi:hypothetical protein
LLLAAGIDIYHLSNDSSSWWTALLLAPLLIAGLAPASSFTGRLIVSGGGGIRATFRRSIALAGWRTRRSDHRSLCRADCP